MGSCGVERLQGAHYGRKEPRGQVPAARAAADRLRPADPSKPLQLLHHLNHPTSLSGVPHPACLPGRPRAAPAVCQPRPRSARRALYPNSPESRAPTTGRGRPGDPRTLRLPATPACTPTHTHPRVAGSGKCGTAAASTECVPTPLQTRSRGSTTPPSRGGRGGAGSARGMEKGM